MIPPPESQPQNKYCKLILIAGSVQTMLQNNADTSIVLEGHSNGVFYHVVHNFIFLFCLSPYFILCGEEYKLQVKNVGVYHEGVDCLVGLLFQANIQNAT